jgi:hypothetical protein
MSKKSDEFQLNLTDEELALQFRALDLIEEAKRRKKLNDEAAIQEKKLRDEGVPALCFDVKRQIEVAELDKKFAALMKIQPLLAAPLMKDVDANAHKYTTTDIRAGLPCFIEIDDTFKLSDKTMSLEAIEKEILEFVAHIPATSNPPKVESIKKTFELVRAEKSAVEALETNAHVPELLSRSWTLTKRMETESKIMEERGKIARLLADNIDYQGGCMAGLVARLYTGSYPFMVKDALEISLVIPQPKSPNRRFKPASRNN